MPGEQAMERQPAISRGIASHASTAWRPYSRYEGSSVTRSMASSAEPTYSSPSLTSSVKEFVSGSGRTRAVFGVGKDPGGLVQFFGLLLHGPEGVAASVEVHPVERDGPDGDFLDRAGRGVGGRLPAGANQFVPRGARVGGAGRTTFRVSACGVSQSSSS